MFVLWLSPKHTPIKHRRPIKKSNQPNSTCTPNHPFQSEEMRLKTNLHRSCDVAPHQFMNYKSASLIFACFRGMSGGNLSKPHKIHVHETHFHSLFEGEIRIHRLWGWWGSDEEVLQAKWASFCNLGCSKLVALACSQRIWHHMTCWTACKVFF